MIPLPRLLPAWVISETEDSAGPTAQKFLDRLSRRRWSVALLEPGAAFPEDPFDLAYIDLSELSGHAEPAIRPLIDAARERGVPLLIRGPASLLSVSAGSDGRRPSPILPERLFDWWGPERMDEELIRNTPDLEVTGITAGLRWAMVETATSVGLAAMLMLASGEATDVAPGALSDLTGAPLSRLADGLREAAGVRRAIACAAVNAGIPAPEAGGGSDGLLPEAERTAGRTVIVGRFPELARKRPEAVVLEKHPGPDDLPSDAAPYVIPGADSLVITASAWSNGSLAGLMRLATGCRVSLVGPGTPLSPALHEYGLHRLGGFVVEDRDSTREVIARGDGVKAFKPFGRQVLISED